MKKILYSAVIITSVMAIGCGPSAEEVAKREQALKDSIAKIEMEAKEKAKQDSIAKAEADAKAAEMEKMKQDSIAKAEEEAKAKKSEKSAKHAAKEIPGQKIDPTKPIGRSGATKVK